MNVLNCVPTDFTAFQRALASFPRLVLGCMHGGRYHGEAEGGRLFHYGWVTVDKAPSAYAYVTEGYTAEELEDGERALLKDWGYDSREEALAIGPTLCLDAENPTWLGSLPLACLEAVVDERMGLKDAAWAMLAPKIAPYGYYISIGEKECLPCQLPISCTNGLGKNLLFTSVPVQVFLTATAGRLWYGELHQFIIRFARWLRESEGCEEAFPCIRVLQRLS